ncbi:UPF0182 family protein [Chamaesiphon minutus]|uniref:UPF0182 protein Cha6605_5250 n=1 Tax=Chamaesiphon minutus (strain ATCC 27169 / PCC 6605) TaxID=1173020 RepID=K9UN87_CHAP6|nr:UPF0182 family protein [Chamaesiphon minutus]AFY96138.1 hypothetical protein Cha6605_5250 [Chamaesiphon minutus PCC 6605]
MALSNLPSVKTPNRYWRSLIIPILLVLTIVIEIGARLGAEILWFQELGYLPMYLLRLGTQGILGVVVFTITTIYLLWNLALAQRLKSPDPSPDRRAISLSTRRPLTLRWLLPLTLSLSLLAIAILVHYGRMAMSQWYMDADLPTVVPPAPILLRPELFWQLTTQIFVNGWVILGVIALAIAILVYPRWLLLAIAPILSMLIAWVMSRQWMRILPFFQATAFNSNDPVFGQDISLYVFSLPVGELLEFWLMGGCLYGFIAVLLTYLLGGDSLSQGRFGGFSRQQQRHLYGVGGSLMLVVAFNYGISCCELLYSPRGVSYGASYTDVMVQLPTYGVLSILALAIAGYCCWEAISARRHLFKWKFIRVAIGLALGLAAISSTILPLAVQFLLVQPNELARETPYIQRTIEMTRKAFGLDKIDAQTFDPQNNLTEQTIQANERTIRNIRLWDQEPLLATNRQLQQIRLYYRFPDADIDRYFLAGEPPTATPTTPQPPTTIAPEPQQVLISARELEYTAVPKQAQTWVNKHLIYTHGYGFTLSPVNRVAPDGLPEYLVKDIGITEGSPLTTSSAAVRQSIPIGQPRIYYGENANNYIMTGTKVKELDYPSGNDNVYNVYDGRGGINIGTTWRKLLFAKYLNDWRMVLTPEFLPETKLLFRRNLNRRIRAIAPFLRYDGDPYLVAADARANPKDPKDPSYLYWIVDAYTTSDRYPYADVGKEGINYIRNSVKVVIDAYHGSVSFYIADPSDPIVTTWAKIFPDLFKPLSAMPANLRAHLRYPADFFKIQSERLMTYHMTDPQVFYNREDQWQIPTEVYGNKPRLVEPYHLITSLPTVPFEEFILLLPYTPQQRTNLIAWLAARSDGENYGKLLLYTFPKQRLVYGPEQIEARINQDPVISQQISLWNRQGSRVIQGNLLIVPISGAKGSREQSLLYVEPLYLEATQNKLPTLIRVIVAYENRIVMAQTLQQALTAIFKTSPIPAPPPIVRPVAESLQP